MTQSKLILTAAVAALTLGVVGNNDTPIEREPPRSQSDILIVGNDPQPGTTATDGNAQDSAKMGKEEGTHMGANQGVTPENDTQKIDQPARRNIPSNGAQDGNATGQ